MPTATLIHSNLEGFHGVVHLYRLDPPMQVESYDYETDTSVLGVVPYVVVSAVNVPYSGPETYIFPADESGKVLSWLEMEGSYRGGLDHAEALKGAGYDVVSSLLLATD